MECDTLIFSKGHATAHPLDVQKEKGPGKDSKPLIYKEILVGDTWIEHVTPAV